MNTSCRQIVASTLVLALSPVVASASGGYSGTPEQRPGGNFYQVVSADEIEWDDAKAAADASVHSGLSGHLATLTSAGEDAYVDQLRQDAFNGEEINQSQVWIGGSQLDNQSAPGVGWWWENGEGQIPGSDSTSPYADWAGGEPNDGVTNPPNVEDNQENHLTLGRFGLGGGWNDEGTAVASVGGYIVEYDVVPQANDDLVETEPLTASGETINIDVLANDDLMSQDVVAINITGLTSSPPPGAMATVVGTAPNLSIDYKSAPGSDGVDTFEYTITDSDGNVSNSATVSIVIDGSESQTPSGDNIIVYSGGGVPLAATGELAQNSATSSVEFGCKIRDPRVYERTRRGNTTIKFRWWKSFDIGAAIDSPLASPECADLLPGPGPGKLKIPPGYGVYTDPSIAKQDLTLDDFVFGLSRVETGVVWSGAIHFDVDATNIAGFSVDCKAPTGGVPEQPLTLGLSTFPPEYTAPWMRPVTIECDPRGVAKWSTWYYTPNAAHFSFSFFTSLARVQVRYFVLRGLIFALGQDDAVEPTLLDAIRSQVIAAQQELGIFPNAMDIQNSIDGLDTATITVLTPSADPDPDPGDPPAAYPGSGVFPNPKGELASQVMALRYAICSELQNVNNLANCKPIAAVDALLPPLP